jgi:deoxyribose-phosphate aldolase
MKNIHYNIQSGADLAALIDHTILKPGVLLAEIDRVCNEAIEYKFASVCIPPLFVKHAKGKVAGSSVKVATVIGFPFGYSAVEAKIAEVLLAMVDGADELDVVINFTAIKNNDWVLVANEINHLMPIIKAKGKTIKTIIESGMLTTDEIIKCCDLYGAASVDFVKTSTGYAEKGASVEAVSLMRAHLPDYVAIKASGGIKTYAFAKELVEAGASRLGCSSSIEIITGKTATGNY